LFPFLLLLRTIIDPDLGSGTSPSLSTQTQSHNHRSSDTICWELRFPILIESDTPRDQNAQNRENNTQEEGNNFTWFGRQLQPTSRPIEMKSTMRKENKVHTDKFLSHLISSILSHWFTSLQS